MQIAGRQQVAAFDPEMIRTMQTALDAAWNALHCDGSELAEGARRLPTRTLLATRIFERARAGETKYGPLLREALEGLLSHPAARQADVGAQPGESAAACIARNAPATPRRQPT